MQRRRLLRLLTLSIGSSRAHRAAAQNWFRSCLKGIHYTRTRTANEVRKLRAYAMAALELTGLPEAAMPYVRENLESSLNPYSVAAAARALRGRNRPEPGITELLFKAIFNIWQLDRPVNFSGYRIQWPQREVSSGLTEIFDSLGHFGSSAYEILPALEQLADHPDKFSNAAHANLLRCIKVISRQSFSNTTEAENSKNARTHVVSEHPSQISGWPPRHLKLEDQDGNGLRWDQFFGQKPTLIGFFYTRCGNPYKCTRTVFNLVRVQDEVERRGLAGRVRVSAISYDSQFDTPTALRSYGEARNFRFCDDYRMFRVSAGFNQLVERMQLEVSFADSQISSHRIELFVLDASGEVVNSFVRLQSEPADLAAALTALVKID